MAHSIQDTKADTLITLTFGENQPFYEVPDLARFLEELSRLYISTIRALRDLDIDYRDHSLSSTEALEMSYDLHSDVMITIHGNSYRFLKRTIKGAHRCKGYYELSDKIKQAEQRYFRTTPEWAPYFGDESDVLRVTSINYNSPMKLGFTGWMLPIVLTIMLAGGKFEGLGFKIETAGLAETAIKINQEFYQQGSDLEIVQKILKETSPNSPILEELQRLEGRDLKR